MTMMYVMHHAFRRDLATFAAAVAVTPVEDREAWVAMNERWALFAASLHHHHHGEDTWLWPALMEKVEADERATLEAMEAEHGEIDPVLEACAAGLARLAERADPDARAALTVRLTAAKASLSRHLHHEETETIALIQRVMTAEEWEAIDEKFKGSITFGEIVKLVPWALHQVPAEVRARLFAEPGGGMHRVMWMLTRRRFERLDRRAFRHLEG